MWEAEVEEMAGSLEVKAIHLVGLGETAGGFLAFEDREAAPGLVQDEAGTETCHTGAENNDVEAAL
jgi:hypothetical protein